MKILIVDDNEDARMILKKTLESNGYSIKDASNGKEAMKIAKASPPNMIISDILMPVMDGFQLCREVISDDRLKGIPFIFYTGTYTDEKDEELALKLGADKFIRKPMEPDEFLEIIQGVLKDAEKGRLKAWAAKEEDKDIFKLYSERLVNKLEKKMLELKREIAERKQVEKALRESAARYRDLFDNSPISLWEEDFSRVKEFLDDLRSAGVSNLRAHLEAHPDIMAHCARMVNILDVNKATIDLFGADSKDEILGNLDKLFIDRSLKVFREELMALHEGKGPFKGEIIGKSLRGNLIDCVVEVIISQGYEDSWSKVLVSVTDITERKAMEKELRESQEQLRNLSRYLQSSREQERTSIAREIHDDLGQALTVLKMDLSWLDKRLPKGQEALFNKIKSMSKLVDATIQAVQRISTELRPGLLDDLGLTAAMEWQAEEFQNRTGIKFEFSLVPEDIVLDQERSTAIFRIFQETLTNITRHANATMVKIKLIEEAGELVLKVRDNGKGITEEQISDTKSFGLMGIRERVHSFGGEVEIKGMPGEGTKMTVSIPVDKG